MGAQSKRNVRGLESGGALQLKQQPRFRFELAPAYISIKYMSMKHEDDEALKKGTAELLVLAQLEDQPRHGYEIGQQIAERGGGGVSFKPASLYPVLYRLERRGLIAGRWVEKAGQRRRRYYRLTPEGRRVLAARRKSWREFIAAVQQAAGVEYA